VQLRRPLLRCNDVVRSTASSPAIKKPTYNSLLMYVNSKYSTYAVRFRLDILCHRNRKVRKDLKETRGGLSEVTKWVRLRRL
jgi:hypothetical protein